jgi:protein SCO1/2
MKAKVKRQKAKVKNRQGRSPKSKVQSRTRVRDIGHWTLDIGLLFFCLLPFAFCLSVAAQPGVPRMNSPLYGQRPEIGEPSTGLPPALQQVSLEQRLNEQVPLDLVFRDETGREVRLAEYFQKGRPVILSLVFYECPQLCNVVLNELVSSIRKLSFDAGHEFEVLTVSFDPREGPELARAKKESYMVRYQRPGTEAGWHFLTGERASIEALTKAVGFNYTYDTATNQFAHPSGIIILTPQGKVARYFYGIEYASRDVRFGLIEASENRIGSPVDQLLLYCYHYDPATGKYGPVVMNIMRVAGIISLIGIASLILILRRKSGDGVRLGQGGTA